jgi:hypothetical protein
LECGAGTAKDRLEWIAGRCLTQANHLRSVGAIRGQLLVSKLRTLSKVLDVILVLLLVAGAVAFGCAQIGLLICKLSLHHGALISFRNR